MARHDASAARPSTPGFGPLPVPPNFGDMATVRAWVPSVTAHSSPGRSTAFVTAVPCPALRRADTAVTLLSTASLIWASPFMAPRVLHPFRLGEPLDYDLFERRRGQQPLDVGQQRPVRARYERHGPSGEPGPSGPAHAVH